jgi:hypothetical protein
LGSLNRKRLFFLVCSFLFFPYLSLLFRDFSVLPSKDVGGGRRLHPEKAIFLLKSQEGA